MTKITNAKVQLENCQEIREDVYGKNFAILCANERRGKEKIILLIWHSFTKNEIQKFSPVLSDRLAVSSDKGIKFVAIEIIRAINK